jgi:23S rRNA (cytosine1962-C5)-methyltransferase
VLNLFGYTGGFSVYAAAAGARSTDTVDIARPAIEAARRNFAANGIDLEGHSFHAADAFAFLENAIERGQTWDIVVSDPPSFAPRKDAVEAARKAYRRLHRLAATVTSRDEDGVRSAGRRWVLEQVHGAAFDHPVIPSFPEGEYLKFAMGRII